MMTSRPSATHPFLLLRDYIMNKELLERESYNEQMAEQRANGIETITFAQWQARKEATRDYFENVWKSTLDIEEERQQAAEAWGV